MSAATRASHQTLILSRREIAALMRPADYLSAVELGFSGTATSAPPLAIAADGGAFHAKAARLSGQRSYVALKLNGNFPGNPQQGLPTIQGAILLSDAGDGRLLAVLDSIEITLRRTAAATALAARYLARSDSATLAMIGCGDQASAQLAALAGVLPIRRCLAYDLDPDRLAAFARTAGGVETIRAESIRAATRAADVIVTCTTATAPILGPDDVRPGSFIAAVGADSPGKNEVAPALMARAKIVVDRLDQCLAMGDLRHAVAAGAVATGDVHAELGELVAGTREGRTRADEITLFDSTGTAVQDVASAAMVFERAGAAGSGLWVALGELEQAA